MPVISFVSPKGGVGKTTTALLLATELAEQGASHVTIISVRKIANGSLVPDSTSSVAPTRGRNRNPWV